MTATKPAASIIDALSTLRRNLQTEIGHNARLSQADKELIALVQGTDLTALAKKDPDAARDMGGKIAMAQGKREVEKIIVSGLQAQVIEFGPLVVEDTRRIVADVGRLADENIKIVRGAMIVALGSLGIFEAERLPRLADESIPVRRERAFNARFATLSHGAGSTYWGPATDGTGSGADVECYSELRATAVISAHDAAEAALAALRARAAELKKEHS